ncbi:MAG: hypothetical protein QXX36_03755, partial [Candidatus Rehaiarchaeum fermentans]|nr:hypothetical protein [Candidatus Rehaiarchaeum fermentans]
YAPVITLYQRARTRERNRAILPNSAIVYYMSSFAQLGIQTINANQTLLLPQYQGITANVTNLSPSVANDLITTANPYTTTLTQTGIVTTPTAQTATQATLGQTSISPTLYNTATPTSLQTINTATSKTVIFKAIYNGAGTPVLPLPDKGTVLKSITITNLDTSNPVYVNGIYVPPQQTLTITTADPTAQLDPTSIIIYNPNNVVINIVYEEEKT